MEGNGVEENGTMLTLRFAVLTLPTPHSPRRFHLCDVAGEEWTDRHGRASNAPSPGSLRRMQAAQFYFSTMVI